MVLCAWSEEEKLLAMMMMMMMMTILVSGSKPKWNTCCCLALVFSETSPDDERVTPCERRRTCSLTFMNNGLRA